MNKKDGDIGHLEGYPREFYYVVSEILKDVEYAQYRLGKLQKLILEYTGSHTADTRGGDKE